MMCLIFFDLSDSFNTVILAEGNKRLPAQMLYLGDYRESRGFQNLDLAKPRSE